MHHRHLLYSYCKVDISQSPNRYFFRGRGATVFVVILWTYLILQLTPNTAMSMEQMSARGSKAVAMHWFRKGLRLHDNPSLAYALELLPDLLYPCYCIDPNYAKPDVVGVNRYNFLLESLDDLDKSLRKLGSRLYVLQGNPSETILEAVQTWGVTHVTFERETEPYNKARDSIVLKALREKGVQVHCSSSHTLHDMERYITTCASQGTKVPTSYQSFIKIFNSLGAVRQDIPAPTALPKIPKKDVADKKYDIPTLRQMGYLDTPTSPFKGGETEALMRMQWTVSERHAWVRKFSKPDTEPNSIEPATTVPA